MSSILKSIENIVTEPLCVLEFCPWVRNLISYVKFFFKLEHKNGLVVKIDDDKNSSDLADAIVNRAKIIITTIQKFEYALPKIESLEKGVMQ